MKIFPVQNIPIQLPGPSRPVGLAVRSSLPNLGQARFGASGKPPVLLIHGLGLTSYSWRRVQSELSDVRETFSVDLLGFGRSSKPTDADYSLPGLARSVLALMDALGIERAPLIGHSLGGGIALLIALMAPERVERLVLIGSVAYPQPEPPLLTLPRLPLAWLPLMLFSRPFIMEALRQVYLRRESLSHDVVIEYAAPFGSRSGATTYQRICRALKPSELQSYISEYPRLKTPALILFGDRDNVVPRWVPERLHEETPHSEYRLFERAGHMLPEEEPERILRWTVPFLRR
jgi:pimeloyl-ACP methyl ester carboxylesterase